MHRARCLNCHKPPVSCVCASVARLNNRTTITIFQHPRERFHPLGTVRFAELGLSHVRTFVTHRHLPQPDPVFSPGAVLLYPDPKAPSLAELPSPPSEIVVVDGTWHHAKTLLRDLRSLSQLQPVRLDPRQPSQYRIRREPRAECLSTLEAVLLALDTIEPELDTASLLDAFRAMIDRQIELSGGAKGGRRAVVGRPQDVRLLPRALAEDFAKLVIVYLERVPTPRGAQLLQWAAWRARDEVTAEALLTMPEDADPTHLVHAGLSCGPGEDPEQARLRFADFAQGGVLSAWQARSLHAALRLAPTLPSVCLKAAFRRGHPDARGTLETCAEALALRPYPLPVHGRAQKRLGHAVAMARYLAVQGKMPDPR